MNGTIPVWPRRLLAAALACAAAATGGCRTTAPAAVDEAVAASQDQVVLAPGDEVDIKFFYVSQLNETQKVRADGRISLQLVGEVPAAGRTPDQLEKDLMERYAKKVEKPDLAVILREQASRVVYVGGAVGEPGQVEMTPRFTVLEAIMKAGGFEAEYAEVNHVVVIRQENGKYAGYGIDLEAILEGKPGQIFHLRPRDIVFVPRTTITDVNTWIDQHISKMIPQFGLPVFFSVN